MTALDYTAFSVGLFGGYLGLVWFFGCKHHWELVDKTEMDSRLETVAKTVHGAYFSGWEKVNLSYRRVILAMRCSKCGRARIHKIDSA